ncbi:hypothetical protein, partial [Neglectibacter timonensis]
KRNLSFKKPEKSQKIRTDEEDFRGKKRPLTGSKLSSSPLLYRFQFTKNAVCRKLLQTAFLFLLEKAYWAAVNSRE